MNPLQKQVAGDHYRHMVIQPIQFAMANQWDACASLALKYIVRHLDKAGAVDIDKAIHCCELRMPFVKDLPKPSIRIKVLDFIAKNRLQERFDSRVCLALHELYDWVHMETGPDELIGYLKSYRKDMDNVA